MRYSTSNLLFALTAPIVVSAASGSGQSTRYWDCCKPSCSWSGKASVSSPALTCDKNDNPITDPDAVSGCDGGSAFACTNYSPWAVNDDLAYGFAATKLDGGSESSWCCACYKLTFTSGPVSGKTMVVQSTNTGGDLGSNHFDLQMPGGGVGIFDGCSAQFSGGLGGAQYGGISVRSDCDKFPELLKDGCYWRFDWFENADNPTFDFEQVQCPKALTDISGCTRDDDGSFPAFSSSSSSDSKTPAKAVTSSSAAAEEKTTVAVKPSSTAVVEKPASSSAAKEESSSSAVVEEPVSSAVVEEPATDAPTKPSATSTPIPDEGDDDEDEGDDEGDEGEDKNAGGCPAPPAQSSASSPSSPSVPSATPSEGSSSIVAIYYQCNGAADKFPNGELPCAKGSKCVYENPYYSQCQPTN